MRTKDLSDVTLLQTVVQLACMVLAAYFAFKFTGNLSMPVRIGVIAGSVLVGSALGYTVHYYIGPYITDFFHMIFPWFVEEPEPTPEP